jgi:hypothetical protein
MGSADDDDDLELKRPKPAYPVSHPTLAWEPRTDIMRAREPRPQPQEPNDGQRALRPRFELNEIDQLRGREAGRTGPRACH